MEMLSRLANSMSWCVSRGQSDWTWRLCYLNITFLGMKRFAVALGGVTLSLLRVQGFCGHSSSFAGNNLSSEAYFDRYI